MAKLIYSFDDYINNPSGPGSAIHGNFNKDQYTKDLMTVESNNGKATYDIYKQTKGNSFVYYLQFKIPSSTKGFFYDVVIELTPDGDDQPSIRTVRKYYVRFFCNDENFVYTYAYAFDSHGVLIKELERQLPFRSTIQKASTRNPDNAMGYNKSIVFAYLVMERDGLFDKQNLANRCKAASIHTIRNSIDPFDKKKKTRSEIIANAKAGGQKERVASTKVIKSKNLLGDMLPDIPKVVKTVKKSSTVNKITSSVKKVKRR